MKEISFNTPKFRIYFSENPGIQRLERLDGLAAFDGNPAGRANVWTLYDKETKTCTELTDDSGSVSYRTSSSRCSVCWRAELNLSGESVTVNVCAEIEGDNVRFSLKDFQETDRVRIVLFRLNGLVAVSKKDPDSRLALPSHGGRLIDPAVCKPGITDHRYNWILDSFGSIAVACTSRMTAVARVCQMDDQLTSEVTEDGCAQVGALLRHRYTIKDPSYRRAKPSRDPKNAEDAEELPIEEEFAVPEDPCAIVDLLAHGAVAPESGWTIGAQHVRDLLPDKPSDYYRGKMVYKIMVGAPNQPPQTDLNQIRSLVFEVAKRTGNGGQVPYLVGFQHKGHDSGYPDVFTLHPALESPEALGRLFADAREVNCTLSFHDNYDDAYADSPSWSADDISRDNEGHLLRGGIWNGVQAYWNSMPWYERNRAEERIRRTLEKYPYLQDTYHLDVLTASVFRIDFRGGDPSGRQQDLIARRKIARRFRSHGLDLSSEACGLPFVGYFTYFWNMQRIPRSCYEGDVRIPMVPFLVHGKADYAGTHVDTPRNLLDGLLYGGFYCNDVNAQTPIKELTDAWYLVQVPLDLLRDDLAVAYEEGGGFKTVRYASGAAISVNFETEECSVIVGGKRIVENGSAMLPQKDGSTLLYVGREEPYSPVRWQTGLPEGTVLKAVPIGVEAPEQTLKVGEDGGVDLELTVGVGYRVLHGIT